MPDQGYELEEEIKRKLKESNDALELDKHMKLNEILVISKSLERSIARLEEELNEVKSLNKEIKSQLLHVVEIIE